MSGKIHLKVITHEKEVYSSDIEELYVKSKDGSLGILANHTPLITSLDVGVAKIVKDNTPQCIAIMGGILQFSDNKATILTDVAELDTDIDVTRAKEAQKRAQERLNAKQDDIDLARAKMALARSIARISATTKHY